MIKMMILLAMLFSVVLGGITDSCPKCLVGSCDMQQIYSFQETLSESSLNVVINSFCHYGVLNSIILIGDLFPNTNPISFGHDDGDEYCIERIEYSIDGQMLLTTDCMFPLNEVLESGGIARNKVNGLLLGHPMEGKSLMLYNLISSKNDPNEDFNGFGAGCEHGSSFQRTDKIQSVPLWMGKITMIDCFGENLYKKEFLRHIRNPGLPDTYNQTEHYPKNPETTIHVESGVFDGKVVTPKYFDTRRSMTKNVGKVISFEYKNIKNEEEHPLSEPNNPKRRRDEPDYVQEDHIFYPLIFILNDEGYASCNFKVENWVSKVIPKVPLEFQIFAGEERMEVFVAILKPKFESTYIRVSNLIGYFRPEELTQLQAEEAIGWSHWDALYSMHYTFPHCYAMDGVFLGFLRALTTMATITGEEEEEEDIYHKWNYMFVLLGLSIFLFVSILLFIHQSPSSSEDFGSCLYSNLRKKESFGGGGLIHKVEDILHSLCTSGSNSLNHCNIDVNMTKRDFAILLIGKVSEYFGGFQDSIEVLECHESLAEEKYRALGEKGMKNDVALSHFKGFGLFQHRSKLYKLLCDCYGIECEIINGWMVVSDYPGNNVPHSWNSICIDGKYYVVDTCYDPEFVPLKDVAEMYKSEYYQTIRGKVVDEYSYELILNC